MRPTEIARRLDFSHDARPLVCWGAKGRRFNILPVLASALLFASVAAGQAEEPIRLHPDNPHFFLWRGQPTVLITAGEHYGAAMNLDFDYVRYLDELKANRFNLTRVFSGRAGTGRGRIAGRSAPCPTSRAIGTPTMSKLLPHEQTLWIDELAVGKKRIGPSEAKN